MLRGDSLRGPVGLDKLRGRLPLSLHSYSLAAFAGGNPANRHVVPTPISAAVEGSFAFRFKGRCLSHK